MKRIKKNYMNQMQSMLKNLDTDQVIGAINQAGLPIQVKRSRSVFGTLKRAAVPAIGVAAAGGYLLFRYLSEQTEVKQWLNKRWSDTRPEEGGQTEEDRVQTASEDSFPASDPPAWTAGTTKEVKDAESF